MPPRGTRRDFSSWTRPTTPGCASWPQQAFAPRVVRALEPEIAATVDGLLDAMAEAGSADLISDLAYPLPVAVICRLLGVPVADESEFSSAAALVAQALDPIMTITGEPAEQADARIAAGDMAARSTSVTWSSERRADPRADLISALIAAEEDGDQLTADEIVATCNLLLIAGHETTVNLIANAAQADAADARSTGRRWRPIRIGRARSSRRRLRFDPPVQLVDADRRGRHAHRRCRRIPPRATACCCCWPAQRDPAMYDAPDEFRPGPGRQCGICPSGSDRTSAWAHRWPGWRLGWR